MTRLTILLRFGALSAACALVLFGADFWKTKDSTQWTSEEINKLLSDSPWARGKTVQPEQSQQRRGGGGRRGGGFGFPGAGGGYPGGGGGYPGGGGGYPGGSNGGDPSQTSPMNLTIRWDSALPVQQALMRQGAGQSDELKAATAATEKYYVISVLGLRLPQARSRSSSYPDDQNSDSNNDDNGQRRNQNNDALRSQLLDAAQLAPKGKSSIYAQDVQIDGPDGIDGVRFLFPRTNPINAADKEVDFILNIRRIKVQEKFKLNDMQYESKLAL
jgi:hypothetical protein